MYDKISGQGREGVRCKRLWQNTPKGG
ncbi:not available (plasmid) [Campylobacter jejuni]|nr:not available [Campylobacter jejuni]